MSQLQADRNLMLGLLALQNDLIDRATLATAVSAWTEDKSRSLTQIFLDAGTLKSDDLAFLETIVDKAMDKPFDGRPKGQESLKFLSTLAEDATHIPDSNLQTGAAFATTAGNVGDDPYATMIAESVDEPAAVASASASSRFMILRPHAKGGLGQVSVALDRELDRSVAVKEIQDRYADHPISRARFIEEAEITGKLEHPGVIPVYSLGQYADGRPFYVMRFIKGDSLKTAIERFHEDEALKRDPAGRSLRLRELLRRFLDACNAIAYAHSRGVLHRDLKPDNIMLGPYGETLVVDWGLAKSLEKEGSSATDRPSAADIDEPIRLSSMSGSRTHTRAGSAMGTPAYASPEQATGQLDIMGPTTDVYGLGATLYHLLAGKAPVDGSTLAEVLQRVTDGQFPPARAVDPTIPAELNAICGKAMATKQQDRYPTVQAMADDIKRWLADETVTAHRETTAQRLKRWLRKHPTATAVSGALILAGLVGAGIIIGIVTRKNVQIALMADDVERSLKVACLGTDALLTEVADTELADVPQMEPVRRRLLEKAQAGFQKFLDRKDDTPVLRWVSGRAHSRLGDILELTGQYKESERSYGEAITLLESLVARTPDEPSYRVDLVRSKLGLGILYKKTNRFPEAEAALRRGADDGKPLAASMPEPYRRMQGDIDYQLGALWAKTARTSNDPAQDRAGEEAYGRAIQAQQDLVKESQGRPDQRAKLGRSLNNLAKLLAATGRSDEAEKLLRDAIALVQDAQALPGARWQYGRASHNLGVLLLRPGGSLDAKLAQADRSKEGLTLLQKAKGLLEILTEEFPKVPQYRQELATICLNLGRIHRMQQVGAEALAEMRRAIDLDTQLADEFPEVPDHRLELARASLDLAADPAPGQVQATEALAHQAINRLETLTAEYPTVADYRNEVGRGYCALARIYLQAGQLSQARGAIDQAIVCQKEALTKNATHKDYLAGLRDGYFVESIVLRQLGETARAADVAEEFLRLAPDDLFDHYRAASLLAECAGSAKAGNDDYARRAVQVLKAAVQKRLIQFPEQLKLKEFQNLKNRDDFRKLKDSLGPAKVG